MIEYVDIGILNFFRNLLPDNFAVVWGPPQYSRQILANAAEEALKAAITATPNSPPTRPMGTIGYPGLTVFRTATHKNALASNPKAYLGWPVGNLPNREQQITINGQPTAGDIVSLSFASEDIADSPVSVGYTVQAGDTFTSIATGLNTAITANSHLAAADITTFLYSYGVNIFKSATSTNTLTITDTTTYPQNTKLHVEPAMKGDFSRILAANHRVTYTVAAWAKFFSDLNVMERELAFSDVYKAVTATILDQFASTWYIEGTDVTYNHEFNVDLGKTEWFGFQKDFYVDSFWAHARTVPPINHIVVNYEQIINGSPETIEFTDIVVDKDQNKIFIP